MLDMQEGRYLSGGQNDDDAEKSVDDDDKEDRDDADALRKAREWDDFKDDNPTGWGNRSTNG